MMAAVSVLGILALITASTRVVASNALEMRTTIPLKLKPLPVTITKTEKMIRKRMAKKGPKLQTSPPKRDQKLPLNSLTAHVQNIRKGGFF